MKTTHLLAVVVLLLGLGAAPAAYAVDEVVIADYCDLAIARLEMVRDLLIQEGRVPDQAEEEAFFAGLGTAAEEFYAFAGSNPKELATYLEENTEVADTIDLLSQEIDSLIAAAEGP